MSRVDATGSVRRLGEVRAQVGAAAERAGRDPADVTVLAVTKMFDAAAVRPVLEAGHRHFGENRVQEALAKWPELKRDHPDAVLHLIGPLQTNKAKDAVGLFDVIETLDRPKLAARLATEMAAQGRRPELLVEVNTGEEPQKAGIAPSDLEGFLASVRAEHGLSPVGLMGIPPLDEAPELHFALLQKLARRCGLTRLSMGMSHDFEAAIAFGATEIRVGTAIFGLRPAR
jgi:pyridoxal phosphate enzyme (YggS family)